MLLAGRRLTACRRIRKHRQPKAIFPLARMIPFLRNRNYSRWSAPLVGLFVGLWIAIRQWSSEEDPDFSFALIAGGLGLAAGLIVLVADGSGEKRSSQPAGSSGDIPESRTIERAMAIIALVMVIFPMVGLIISLIALAANFRHPGWPRVVSALSVLISVGIHVILFYWWGVG
jgi:hypothetical protein